MKKSGIRIMLRRIICFKSVGVRIEISALPNISIEKIDLPAISVLFAGVAERSHLNRD